MKRFVYSLVLTAMLFAAAPAGAQTVGTFRWRLGLTGQGPNQLGSVLVLTVTQQGSLFLINGIETQCGGNASLPVTGSAVVQANGQVMLGLTTINERGRGVHTNAVINTTDFNGSWSDNTGYFNQPFVFNPPSNTCPGGLRTDPSSGDVATKQPPQ